MFESLSLAADQFVIDTEVEMDEVQTDSETDEVSWSGSINHTIGQSGSRIVTVTSTPIYGTVIVGPDMPPVQLEEE